LSGLAAGSASRASFRESVVRDLRPRPETGPGTGAHASHPVASGFVRLLAAPGLELDMRPFKVYSAVELSLSSHFTGVRLVAKTWFRLNVS
jgi:hypothetical protein